MLNCRELARLVASGELEDAGWWQRVSARFHLLMCRFCKRYESQVRQLNEAARTSLRSVEPSAETLERLQQRILEQTRDD